MLLTITYTGERTQDIGYLLHKNPERPQEFSLSYGKAYVFYPEISDKQTTVALLMDTNPIDLARGKLGSRDGGLFDYVNDRPYVSSSFMSTAIARVFNTAMSGRCDAKPELVDRELDLSVKVYSLPVRADKTFLNEVFEPLGYTVTYETKLLDEQFPEWGESPYVDLELKGHVKLSMLLNHLYVLMPVFDRQKHYYINREEIDKLIKHGEGWLETHPAKKRIVSRYFMKAKSFANQATERLMEETDEKNVTETEVNEDEQEEKEEWTPLNTLRLNAVRDAVLSAGATSVLDIGCGTGKLLSILLEEKQLNKVSGADVSVQALERAKQRLHVDHMPTYKKDKLALMQGSLIYRDSRFSGYDAICVVEVIEHIDQNRHPAFEQTVFVHARPKTVILTTPNKEYNAHYEMKEDSLRHGDHRFEWTRKEFQDWTEHICETYGYTVEVSGIGEVDEAYGQPTQMGVFTRCE